MDQFLFQEMTFPVVRPDDFRIGTSSFTAPGWDAAFYSPRLPQREWLSYYAERFNTLEIDSTFYSTPPVTTIDKWYRDTPADFLFALKMPQVITHEKRLERCESDLDLFLDTASHLREKLGPILIQFPYFNRDAFSSLDDFLQKLHPFVARLPRSMRFALEVRNRTWLAAPLLDVLTSNNVALSLIDFPRMPEPSELAERDDLVTTDFTYVRLLGDRHGIEEKTKRWDRVVVDRSSQLEEWISFCRKIRRGGTALFVYINNHYAGFAPATVREFVELWRAHEE